MKPENNKQFSTIRKLSKKVEDLEKRCEEVELVIITILQEKKQ